MLDLGSRLPDLKDIPVKIVWGLRDPCFHREMLSQVAHHFPQAEILEIPQASHLVLEDAPEVANPIPDMQVDVDAECAYTDPLATVSDQDVGDSLIYSATNGAGFSLPDWISFDRSSRTFTGTPTASEVGILEIRVNAVDTSNAIAFDVFELTIGSGSTWHNADRPTDVSGDSSTSAIDALIMIDFLNTIGAFRIPPNEASEFGFVDVNNDGSVSAIDALIVIDELNTRGAAEGEFDRPAFFQPAIDLGGEEDEDEELIRLLALDSLEGA